MTTQTLPAPSQPPHTGPNCASALTIDMLTPVEAGLQLQLSADALLDVVNRGLLPAYDLGGHIRFRAADVAAVANGIAA